MNLIDMILHVDKVLAEVSQWMGPWLYVLMFAIIFAETGLVVTPFLPGDSLLFALGALCAVEDSGLNVYLMAVLLMVAGILGDNVNYFFGARYGRKVFDNPNSKIFKRKYLEQTEAFYAEHGSRAIVIGRFAPILRTFVPFVAGIGKMSKKTFFTYNVVGAILWVNSFLFAGLFFGNLPVVQKNFHIVIFGVIGVSLIPVAYEAFKAHKAARNKS